MAKEAVGAALSAPVRLWKALTTPKATVRPVEPPPKPPVAPRPSAALRDEFEKLEQARAAKEAERQRVADQKKREAENEARLKPLRNELNAALERAKTDSEVSAILQEHGLNAFGSRSRSELADSIGWREAKRAISKLDAERSATVRPASPSTPQPDPSSPPAPRRKSGPNGPKF